MAQKLYVIVLSAFLLITETHAAINDNFICSYLRPQLCVGVKFNNLAPPKCGENLRLKFKLANMQGGTADKTMKWTVSTANTLLLSNQTAPYTPEGSNSTINSTLVMQQAGTVDCMKPNFTLDFINAGAPGDNGTAFYIKNNYTNTCLSILQCMPVNPGNSGCSPYITDVVWYGAQITAGAFLTFSECKKNLVGQLFSLDMPCSPGCNQSALENSQCDAKCNVRQCRWDLGHCTKAPTKKPTKPTRKPTTVPTPKYSNSTNSTLSPTMQVTLSPSMNTQSPTLTLTPTSVAPTVKPTSMTRFPTSSPTKNPTFSPSSQPTVDDSSAAPSSLPTRHPVTRTKRPTRATDPPTSFAPSASPTIHPSRFPTQRPTTVYPSTLFPTSLQPSYTHTPTPSTSANNSFSPTFQTLPPASASTIEQTLEQMKQSVQAGYANLLALCIVIFLLLLIFFVPLCLYVKYRADKTDENIRKLIVVGESLRTSPLRMVPPLDSAPIHNIVAPVTSNASASNPPSSAQTGSVQHTGNTTPDSDRSPRNGAPGGPSNTATVP